MRFTRARIDGYGRLSGADFSFPPGLLIILGPNERGKSTLRCCITDLLFGQRHEDGSYDEANQLRQPWQDPETYGGALTYALDNGQSFTIERTFHPHHERIVVLDHATGKDITDQFPRLAYGWPAVGETHLGISRSAFIGAATIGHFSLDDLGGQNALSGIRDRLLAVADSGGGRSAEKASRQLEQWARLLEDGPEGRGPLPHLKKRLRALKEEAESGAAIMEQRRSLLARLRAVRDRRDELERNMQTLTRRWEHARYLDRKRRFAEARRLLDQLEEARRTRFELAPYRDTPREGLDTAQRLVMRIETLRLQIERERQELTFLEREWEAGLSGADPGREAIRPVPESLERERHDLAAEEQRLTERAAQIQEQVRHAQQQIIDVQQKLAELPDFSRLAGQAIDWLSQLQQLAETARRQLETHRTNCERLRSETAQAREAIREDRELFADFDSFAERLRAHEAFVEKHREEKLETEKQINHIQGAMEESSEQFPGLWGLNALCAVVLTGLIITYLLTFRLPVLYPLGIVGVAQLYFLYSIFRAYDHHRTLRNQLAQAREKLESLSRAELDRRSPVDEMLQRAGCQTARELEARYDRYREARARLEELEHRLAQAESDLADSEERLPRVMQHIARSLDSLGETVSAPGEVAGAVARLIDRYHAYREQKRKMSELRNMLQSALERQRTVQHELAGIRQAMESVDGRITAIMRDSGYTWTEDEDILSAMRGYNEYLNRMTAERSRLDTLRERASALRIQLEEDGREEARLRAQLNALLREAGAVSMEDWQSRAQKAWEYETWSDTCANLEERLNLTLGRDTLESLERSLSEIPANLDDHSEPEDPDAIAADLSRCREELDHARHEEAELLSELSSLTGSIRPPARIQEEIAWTRYQLNLLETEQAALALALSTLEEAALQRHRRIAPGLSRYASRFLEYITGGVHTEVRVGPDLSLSLKSTQDGSEAFLSKGALDQLYLALRLALVQRLSRNGERLPMLLDDPFANYDDVRLRAALVLLREIGREYQILLFTCRQDTAHQAEQVGIPVMVL